MKKNKFLIPVFLIAIIVWGVVLIRQQKKYNTISKRNQRIIYKNKCSTRRTRSKQTKSRRRNK